MNFKLLKKNTTFILLCFAKQVGKHDISEEHDQIFVLKKKNKRAQ
jgi:hypothetical protein